MENKDVSEKGNDRDKKSKLTHEAMGITWDGANPNAYVVAENEVTDYFTYPDTTSKNKLPGILAHAWRKLTYHNLYAGIDVEFNYPEKGGLEMNIIVHPGADISKVKMHYNGAKTLLKSNDIYISSDCTDFLAHAPVTKDENNNAVKSSISLNSGNISFKTNTYNNHKALTLSNWFSGTSFTGLNSAFDIGYDVSGNVYVFGGGSSTEYQLQKYNSSGTLQWTYTPSTWPEGGGFNYYYGDLVTDTRNGDCYINAGTGGGYSTAGAQINKVSPSGILLKNFPGDTKEQEMWRMDLDYCHNLLVIAAGDAGSPPYQAYTIDTGFVAGTPVNVLGTDSAFHDMALLALDQTGHAYMATSKSAGGASSYIADNVMLSVPIPALAPTAYQVSDGYSFVELSSISYYGSVFGGYPANGMNGLVANSHMVVSYDGATVKKWTTTGTLKKSLGLPGGTSFTQGGLDLDCQGNIYAGNGSSIDVYDSTLTTLIGSIPYMI
jgi:hypothetical protein